MSRKIIINLLCFIAATAAIVFLLNKDNKMSIGIDKTNLDLTLRPQDNFYDFATSGWRKNNPLTGEYSRYGVFDKLGQQVLKQVQDLILEASKNPSNDLEKKIGIIYNQAMDFDKRNKDGIEPIKKDFSEIDNIKNMAEYLGKAHRVDSPFWGTFITNDARDSDHYMFCISQAGLSLPRDYLLDSDKKSVEVRQKYKKYMADVFKMFGITDAPAEKVYELELEMAHAFYPKEKLRDPIANYHKMSFNELKKKFPGFDWDTYFSGRGITPEFVDVGQIEPIEKSIDILKSKDQRVLRAYLKWNVANGSMTVLGDDQYNLYFDFYGKVLSGKKERKPKWKDATSITESVMGEAIGQVYVDKYFPAQAKKRMKDLVENLRKAYRDRIENLDWMDKSTKEKALDKLAAFNVKIGYPDKWRDLSKLEIVGDSLYADLNRAELFEDDFWLEKLREKDVDRSIWFMDPQTVNAYYDPSQNEIVFPAAILQPPFFDMNADDAFNYGAIGSVIGHEMTHGFDDSGRHFDAHGNMNEWWSNNDSIAFGKKADVMKDFFNNINVAPGHKANGEFTLGENLADYGGLVIAFDAYKKYGTPSSEESHFSADQRYFIAYAGIETGNITIDEVIKRTKTDEHSLSEWRVNGILPHVDAWYDAFGVTVKDKMFVPKDKRCRLW
jgi:putative endopeptidase